MRSGVYVHGFTRKNQCRNEKSRNPGNNPNLWMGRLCLRRHNEGGRGLYIVYLNLLRGRGGGKIWAIFDTVIYERSLG